MANSGSPTENLWRDLIADEVGYWLQDHPSVEHADLLDYIRTGVEK